MKINTIMKYIALGAAVFVLAFVATTQTNKALAYTYDDCDYYYCEDNCDYYNDCGLYDDDYYYDDCDYDCGGSYDDGGSVSQSTNVTNSAYAENNIDIVIDYVDVPEEYDDVDGYCTANVSTEETGETVMWDAYGFGGNGYFSYDWSGTDGLSGYYPGIDKDYSKTGTKTATVKIKSNNQTITRTCSVKIEDKKNNNDDDLDAYCKAVPSTVYVDEEVKFTAYPDGGDNDYDYDWDGDDNLSGSKKTIYHTYRTTGRKDVEVEVRSDGDRVTATCDVNVIGRTVTYNPPVYQPPVYVPPQTGGIYLSSIPATGISPNLKVALFTTGMLMWSAFLAYLYIARRNEKMKEKAILESLGE